MGIPLAVDVRTAHSTAASTLKLCVVGPPFDFAAPRLRSGRTDFSAMHDFGIDAALPRLCSNVIWLDLEDGDRLTGRSRTPSDAQRHGNEEKLTSVLFGADSDQTLRIGIINQAQPQQGNP